ncbi:hypothetical protein [Caproiciproducens sp. CPB-2]|uniref:hypothetical protein n=1 Tax=Caproiciproducens sp. CPB-2 TaxID=3030017 RepID=UPI0023DCB79F|nr:hypothetical protein [Caproiciproducens sp. CPB-2]MDF1495563.1 hypothetical protein [Caproiciproducens sp. CPB-2]
MKTGKFAAAIVLVALLTILTACSKAGTAQNSKPEIFQPAQSVQNIDRNEAMNAVKNMIRMDYTKYKIDLINGNFEYQGNQYYQFLISDKSESIEPSIIVSKHNGAVLCYYPDDTVTQVYQDGVFKSKC